MFVSFFNSELRLLDWITQKDDAFQLPLSVPIWEEYNTVAGWLIPETQQVEKQRVLNLLQTQAIWVKPVVELQVCRDDSDNRFLECAIAGGADYLITKNIKHFPYKRFESVKIVRIREFLDILETIAGTNTR